ncbi:hypothetical protein SRHO_G00136280 [Serrasalmus rhombeus]
MQNSLLSTHLLTSFKKSTALVQGKKSQIVESKGRLCAIGGLARTLTTTEIYSTIHPVTVLQDHTSLNNIDLYHGITHS